MHSGSILKSLNTKTKAKVKNPATKMLDILPYYHNHQPYSRYLKNMAEDIDFKISHFHNFEGPLTLTVTSDDLESHR